MKWIGETLVDFLNSFCDENSKNITGFEADKKAFEKDKESLSKDGYVYNIEDEE